MHRMLKTTVLSIATLTVMSGAAVAPALGSIARDFPQVDETLIKMIVSLPPALIIPFTFVSSFLVGKWGKKPVILLGLIIYLLGGVGGGFVDHIFYLLFFRALLGVGVGLIMPLSTSVISDFFEGEERTQMMGYVSAANSLGGAVSLLLSGWLAAISWHYSFYVYFFSLLVAVLVWLFFPRTENKPVQSASIEKMPRSVYGLALSMCFVFIAFYSISTGLDFFVIENNIGNSQTSGLMIAIGTVTGFFAGWSFSWLKKRLGPFFFPFQLLLMAVGFGSIAFFITFMTTAVGTGLIGFAVGSIIPDIFVRVPVHVKQDQTVKAMAIVSSMMYLGQFASPLVLDWIGEMLNHSSVLFTYKYLTVLLGIISAVSFTLTRLRRNKSRTKP